MNTSVIVTLKDGSTTVYPSLEEASIGSGLSESAIKIRCNKSRDGSCSKKDKIHCKWVDDTTFRSYQAKKSKHKGSSLESDVVKTLKEVGYAGACRAAAESKCLDNNKVDIADTLHELPIAIQCKATQNLPNYFKIREASTDPRDLVLIWKKQAEENSISLGTLAIVPYDHYFKLLKLCKQNSLI